MRSIRDQISARIAGMSFEEELEWLASEKLDDPVLRRLRERAAQQAASDGRK
jgi:PHD/YefM family antitoxin component YafN of YafNO toxin-antitoxin module